MSVPKKRRTTASRKRRASHHSIFRTALTQCSECGSRIRPHRACPECGYYKKKKKVSGKRDRTPAKKKT